MKRFNHTSVKILALYMMINMIGITGFGQVSPPAAYPSSVAPNAQRTWEPVAPETNAINLLTRPAAEVRQTTVYYDGMGRKMETVSRQVSPLGNDLVTAFTYDSWGRQTYQYLPFVSTGNDGNFKLDPFQQQATFYSDANANSPIKGQGETWLYGKANYENSPQNRMLNQLSAGVNWVGSESGATPHKMIVQEVMNTPTDNVRIWNIPINTPNSIPTSTAAYAAGTLYKTIHTDESGHQRIEFTDMDGHMVLLKEQETAAADNGLGSAHTGWRCTYNVFDDYGNARYSISPKLVKLIDGTWIISQLQADELCNRFEYDLAGRIIIKKMAGTPSGSAGEVWMVYDQRNRLVMQQDGNSRGLHQWQYFQYDALDRPVVSGLLTDPVNYNNLNYHTSNASTRIDWPVLSSYTTELLTQSFYDNYSWMSAANSGTLPSTLDGGSGGAGNAAFTTSTNVSPLYAQPLTQTTMTRGMLTGSKSEVLGSSQSQYLYAVTFYDYKGRSIQSQAINATGGKDISTTQYDWSGKILTSVVSHSKAGTNPQSHIRVTALAYDAGGRITSVTKSGSSSMTNTATGQVTNLTIPATLLETNSYNELGRLKSRTLGSSLESMAYEYNIRGWSLGMNRDYAKTTGSTAHYFGYDLGFDKTAIIPTGGSSIGSYNAAVYNGNIAGTVWKSRGDGVARKYDYAYDNVNQLQSAGYLQSTVANTWDNSYLDFSVSSIAYDANGNISNESKKGYLQGGSQNIDNLAYNYMNSGTSNKLQNVLDNSPYNTSSPNSVIGDFHYATAKTGTSTDYAYDANGNIVADANRAVQSISYNYLNLPALITISGAKGTIQYVYDASGTKLKKITTENSTVVNYNNTNYTTSITTTTSYIGNFVYQTKQYGNSFLAPLNYTDQLLYSAHEQGRIRYIPALGTAPASFVFDYFMRDFQDNTRMVLTTEVQSDVYPAVTLETATFNGGTALSTEQSYYNINTANSVGTGSLAWWASATGSAYANQNNNGNPANPNPYSNTTATSTQVYQLNGNTNGGMQTGDRFGLGITLKVMAGDQISVFGKSVYHLNAGSTIPAGSYPVSAILSSLLSAFANTVPVSNLTHGTVTGASLNGSSATTGPLTTTLNNVPNPSDPTHTPKAGINWILFDDQFRVKASGFEPVNTTSDVVKTHNSLINIPMACDGYLYVFCSNESNINVYFDNLQVVHTRGPIVEENHYYPEGLSMAGISDRAWNKQINFYHYQSKEMQNMEFNDGTGLEEYDFAARFYDAQLGRWTTQDPAGQFASPYLGMANNWGNSKDPNGKFVFTIITFIWDFLRTGFTKGGFEFWNWGKPNFNHAWAEFDPTRTGSETNNAFKIDMGMFKTDHNRTFFGQVLQLLSRFTWESGQNVLGNLASHVRNLTGSVSNVEYYDGATLVNQGHDYYGGGWGFTLGSYINSKNASTNPADGPAFELFRHEYGHTLQSRIMGPLYISHVGIPSLLSEMFDGFGWHNHNLSWFETQANKLSLKYFEKFEPGTLDPASGGIPWNSNDNAYPTKYKADWFWLFIWL